MTHETPLLTMDHFGDLVGRSWGAEPALTLVAVHALPIREHPGRVRDPFTLEFHATTAAAGQGMVRLDVPGVGATDIFLVATGRAGEATVYEAVFA